MKRAATAPRCRPAAAVLALTTLWLAQPLYDLLGSMPEYFLVRGLAVSGPWLSDVWIFALGAFLVPPLVLVATAELAGLLGRRTRRVVYAAEIGLLSAWGVLLMLRLLDASWRVVRLPAWLVLPLALIGGAVMAREHRRPALALVLTLVALLAPAAPLLFCLRTPIRAELATPWRVASTEELSAADVPVVIVVLDELPLSTLLTPEGDLDAALFPHLAALASTATWYRGAATPHFFTQLALPAIAAGVPGDDDRLATARSYPRNLFSLLRGSHHVLSDEPMTALDPARQPPPLAARLSALAADAWRTLAQAGLPPSWASVLPQPELRRQIGAAVDPTERFLRFVDHVESELAAPGGRPPLVFSHLVLPHHPWLRDAQGALYDPGDELLIAGLDDHSVGAVLARWQDDWETVLDAYERHVAQTRHTDALLGRLFSVLRGAGLFERALIVVTADHGIHFEPNAPARRSTRESAESLARVPLLVKLPGQTQGVVDDSARSTLDVLPTVLDVLGVDDGGLGLAGTPLTSPPVTQSTQLAAYQRLREEWFERRSKAGPDGFGPGYQTLAGYRPGIGGVPSRDWVVAIDRAHRFESVAADLPPPRWLRGSLLPRRPEVLEAAVADGRPLPLAVAVDGVFVASTGSSAPRAGRDDVPFSVLLPAAAVAPGEHQVIVYLVGQSGDADVALPVPRRAEPSIRLEGDELLLGHTRVPLLAPGDPTTGLAASGEAVVLRFDGIGPLLEVFGSEPMRAGTQVEDVFVFRGETLLARAERGKAFGGRYQLPQTGPEVAGLFRTVVPGAWLDDGADLRVVALLSEAGDPGRRLAVELPLQRRLESAWRITGPFRLQPDPRRPSLVYQNY